ncbi:unnamed protein product [Hermetia illucens]|uniref:Uncharacterized protein n=1 Tax=Hermetia illucens TaxID=343691 RepID=A0A7R8Z0I0_HERIL|nr:unnamed protein product [Hermetia illucens]
MATIETLVTLYFRQEKAGTEEHILGNGDEANTKKLTHPHERHLQSMHGLKITLVSFRFQNELRDMLSHRSMASEAPYPIQLKINDLSNCKWKRTPILKG